MNQTNANEAPLTVLVAGATGATGKWLVKHLLDRGVHVRAFVRPRSALPEMLDGYGNLSVIRAALLDLSDGELAGHVKGCAAVVSCLGHNMSFKGMFLPPRKLVRDAVRRLCAAVRGNNPAAPVKFILMNTVGNRNRDLSEPRTTGEQVVIGLIRLLIPIQADNEQAADYLRTQVGQDDPEIEWTAVRPDSLTNEETVTEYTVHPSPLRSPIFDPGRTSRINVGHFMARLITEPDIWNQWKGQMPVIYNDE